VIDRQIQQALGVDPSPEFLARVRQRIADEPSPRSAVGFAVWTTAAFGVIALAAAVVTLSVVRSQPRAVPGAGHAMILTSRQLAAGVAAVVVPAPPARHAVAARPVRAPLAIGPSAPKVLISAAESRAIRSLIAGVRDGRIDPRSLPVDPPPASDIIIPPIVIAPISAPSIGEGVRQ
jgi:hypothetical protein